MKLLMKVMIIRMTIYNVNDYGGDNDELMVMIMLLLMMSIYVGGDNNDGCDINGVLALLMAVIRLLIFDDVGVGG